MGGQGCLPGGRHQSSKRGHQRRHSGSALKAVPAERGSHFLLEAEGVAECSGHKRGMEKAELWEDLGGSL